MALPESQAMKLCCSVCLDVLTCPVTIPCGHSYCRSCIQAHWDNEDGKGTHSCPQCRATFTPRPALQKNTLLAELLEDLGAGGLPAAPDNDLRRYAGPGDVSCDLCAGRKLKALRSCLDCLVSYCEAHLGPHLAVAPLRKHRLTEPTAALQESACPAHAEPLRMFCRTDGHAVCHLCIVDGHRGHDVVTAAVERAERQRELGPRRRRIQEGIRSREAEAELLQMERVDLDSAADAAAAHTDEVCGELVLLLQEAGWEAKQRIRTRQAAERDRMEELRGRLAREAAELRGADAELERLSGTQDHIQFLQSYLALSDRNESTLASPVGGRPLDCFEDVMAAVSRVRGQLQELLRETWRDCSPIMTEVEVLAPRAEPETRANLLKYSQEITMDERTANGHLMLSKGNSRITYTKEAQAYLRHPDRFTEWFQVLSEQSLSGRCYWEVEREGRVRVAVAYRSIGRAGRTDESKFGYNPKSWMLDCTGKSYRFHHDRALTPVLGPQSSRIGVYLDHGAGVLSFYSVAAHDATLLHTVRAAFTQPLHAGVCFWNSGLAAEFCWLG